MRRQVAFSTLIEIGEGSQRMCHSPLAFRWLGTPVINSPVINSPVIYSPVINSPIVFTTRSTSTVGRKSSTTPTAW